ncbi:hypothetical protein C8J56DRAFT_1171412 [Mycena floridula]|nr:hypothetical protein C8J56DRAFT_1171412 [Mycena floridula]
MFILAFPLFLMLSSRLVVNALPLPLTIAYNSDDITANQAAKDHHALIETALVEANKKINIMVNVCKPSKPDLKKWFGAKANCPEIKKVVGLLKDGKINIPSVAAHGNALGAYDKDHGSVSFGTGFYTGTLADRVGTIIHEATHALGNTVDWFLDGKPFTEKLTAENKVAKGMKNGYATSPDFAGLLKDHSDQMHHNADSYKVFAEAM